MIFLDRFANRSWADVTRDPVRDATPLDVPVQFLPTFATIHHHFNHARWLASVDLPRRSTS